MITWSTGSTTMPPRFNFPKELDAYDVDAYTFGSNPNALWNVSVLKHGFGIVHDHFRTQEEAFDFVVSVVTMLEMKYPNAVCNNFSFLTKE